MQIRRCLCFGLRLVDEERTVDWRSGEAIQFSARDGQLPARLDAPLPQRRRLNSDCEHVGVGRRTGIAAPSRAREVLFGARDGGLGGGHRCLRRQDLSVRTGDGECDIRPRAIRAPQSPRRVRTVRRRSRPSVRRRRRSTGEWRSGS
jgi:hypothetical protein